MVKYMEIKIRQLMEYDKPLVMELNATDDLRPEGILERGTKYWGAFENDKLVGVIGCEHQNCYGLLRSALVDKQFRNMGTKLVFKEVAVEEAVKNLSVLHRLNCLRHLGAFPQKLLIKLNLRIFRPNSFLATELFSI